MEIAKLLFKFLKQFECNKLAVQYFTLPHMFHMDSIWTIPHGPFHLESIWNSPWIPYEMGPWSPDGTQMEQSIFKAY
jgi:hypothetical protein